MSRRSQQVLALSCYNRAMITRDFTATTFVVSAGRTLLLLHRKLAKWLPPGGHIEPNELPHIAALREVREEAGLAVELVSTARQLGAVTILPQPHYLLLEVIEPGHEHIDLIYFAHAPHDEVVHAPREVTAARWFSWDDLGQPEVEEDIRVLGREAIEVVSRITNYELRITNNY